MSAVVGFVALGVIVLAGLLLLTSYYLYRGVFCYPSAKQSDPKQIPDSKAYGTRREEMRRVMEQMKETDWETVYLTAADGCRLFGRLRITDPGAPLFLFFHGYHGTFMWDGYGCFRFCRDRNYNMLMVDERAHGKSGGKAITFGILEREDCRLWAEYAAERTGGKVPIILSGVSMGAATVLMASVLALPESVMAVVADCGYTSPREIIQKTAAAMHFPVGSSYLLLRAGARIFGRFDLEAASPLEAVRQNKLPVLFVQGGKDSVVPMSMCDALFDACAASKERLVVAEAEHAVSAMEDYGAYEAALDAFLKKRCSI